MVEELKQVKALLEINPGEYWVQMINLSGQELQLICDYPSGHSPINCYIKGIVKSINNECDGTYKMKPPYFLFPKEKQNIGTVTGIEGCGNNTALLDSILRSRYELNKPIYIATLDISKAFPSVKQSLILKCSGRRDFYHL